MQAVIDFILELDKLKSVSRKTRPVGVPRYENSAEHSWQIAVFAAALAPHAGGPIDLDRVIWMLLVHDVGEIDTGDAFFFADGHSAQKVDERAAVERLFGMLPESERARFLAAWTEFEENLTPEARFAHAVDRVMPVLLNLKNRGGSWRENGVSYERVVERVGPAVRAGCPALWEHVKRELDEAQRRGWWTEAPA